jgi:hypothetical protein
VMVFEKINVSGKVNYNDCEYLRMVLSFVISFVNVIIFLISYYNSLNEYFSKSTCCERFAPADCTMEIAGRPFSMAISANRVPFSNAISSMAPPFNVEVECRIRGLV